MISSIKEAYLKRRKCNNRHKRQENERNSEMVLTIDDTAGEPESDPTETKKRITWTYRKFKKVELYPHMIDDPKRPPTEAEYQHAKKIADRFFNFSGGKVVVCDKQNRSKILAVIEFTPIDELTETELKEINSVTTFLHKAKKFVKAVAGKGRSWGGWMRMIGWRKGMDEYELLGRYRDGEAIAEATEEYDELMRSSATISDIIGGYFKRLANVVFADNQDLMKTNSIPTMAALDVVTPLSEFDCAPNLSFTAGGFVNSPHKDEGDISEFAFVMWVPTNIGDGSLARPSDGYDVTGGAFVFPDYGFGIDFSKQKGIVKMVWRAREVRHCTLPTIDTPQHTRTGMSLQVNKKTANACRDIENETIYDRPSNKEKDKSKFYYGDHANHMSIQK
ncbi:hypothetical protein PTTG_00405 [Puccinia triticina 1-1 BBBD Race 1]|uniref:Tet-like 2OG-Fe(II) oxygenase domain-containing protein n=1 Tax=Puccinia triticina (isolate 1-1 / race 1 (BBBD)) TaxID=630390 RepID=A0A180G700_PUCT1|nr:hypothetical protein PTTG_00405 [Puccinia triticina 1-1 BBBD Race 1]